MGGDHVGQAVPVDMVADEMVAVVPQRIPHGRPEVAASWPSRR